MKSGVIITIAIVVLLAVVGGYFLLSQSDTIEETSSFCTADVFECPDGSFVQRNPDNNCEFNTCPAINNQTNDSEPIDALAYIIEIKNFAFAPSTLEINVGDMVTWDNKDSATHSIKSDSGSGACLLPSRPWSFHSPEFPLTGFARGNTSWCTWTA